VQNGTIHEKKAQSFFAAAQYCGRKKKLFFSFFFVIFEVKFVCVFIFLCGFFSNGKFFLTCLENFDNSNCWVGFLIR